MNEPGKSDNRVVPEKVSNKARRRRVAERLEERRLGERNRPQARALRTQGRTSEHGARRRVGAAAVEDKIVQRATVAVLTAVYEPEFVDFSYGARPGRSAHQALAALDHGLMKKPINWVLDADLRDFFGSLNQGDLVRFVEHRIGDKRVVRLIQRWLAAGVLEDGAWTPSERGTAQGGSISPLTANLYLHYVFVL